MRATPCKPYFFDRSEMAHDMRETPRPFCEPMVDRLSGSRSEIECVATPILRFRIRLLPLSGSWLRLNALTTGPYDLSRSAAASSHKSRGRLKDVTIDKSGARQSTSKRPRVCCRYSSCGTTVSAVCHRAHTLTRLLMRLRAQRIHGSCTTECCIATSTTTTSCASPPPNTTGMPRNPARRGICTPHIEQRGVCIQ